MFLGSSTRYWFFQKYLQEYKGKTKKENIYISQREVVLQRRLDQRLDDLRNWRATESGL